VPGTTDTGAHLDGGHGLTVSTGRSDREFVHQPVLLGALLARLSYRPEAVVVDATVGQGGHAVALAERLGPAGWLIGLDVDATCLESAARRLAGVPCRVELVRENFARLEEVLSERDLAAVDVILADLGLSSAQLAQAARGFSFQMDGPLDMRLDDRQETTAGDLINALPLDELAEVIRRYGQERHSRRIARAIVRARRRRRIETTGELVAIINAALGITGRGRRSRIHPATRTFQALRIAVNEELESLERLLAVAPRRLRPGGQIAVISFHSLEDHRVKTSFREQARAGEYEVLTRKPIRADETERAANPRSRSARLRVARKLAPPEG